MLYESVHCQRTNEMKNKTIGWIIGIVVGLVILRLVLLVLPSSKHEHVASVPQVEKQAEQPPEKADQPKKATDRIGEKREKLAQPERKERSTKKRRPDEAAPEVKEEKPEEDVARAEEKRESFADGVIRIINHIRQPVVGEKPAEEDGMQAKYDKLWKENREKRKKLGHTKVGQPY